MALRSNVVNLDAMIKREDFAVSDAESSLFKNVSTIFQVIAVLLLYFSLQFSFAQGSEYVKQSTIAEVVTIQKDYPNFKLSPEAQQCLDGKLKDPDCDGLISDEASIYKNKQRINTTEQRINTTEQQLELANRANYDLEIVIGLIQLGTYVDYGKIPNPEANYLKKIQSNPNAPNEVQDLCIEILDRHNKKLPLTYNPYGAKLLTLAKQYLDEAIQLEKQITDSRFKTSISAITNNARSMYYGYRRLKESSEPK